MDVGFCICKDTKWIRNIKHITFRRFHTFKRFLNEKKNNNNFMNIHSTSRWMILKISNKICFWIFFSIIISFFKWKNQEACLNMWYFSCATWNLHIILVRCLHFQIGLKFDFNTISLLDRGQHYYYKCLQRLSSSSSFME